MGSKEDIVGGQCVDSVDQCVESSVRCYPECVDDKAMLIACVWSIQDGLDILGEGKKRVDSLRDYLKKHFSVSDIMMSITTHKIELADTAKEKIKAMKGLLEREL